MAFSKAYVEHLQKGPFPGQVDPWAEAGRYFQQIHSSMIDNLVAQSTPVLLEMGYIVGREASLQIADGREPDIFVQAAMNAPTSRLRWDYETAASEVLAEPGVSLAAEVELDALHIKHLDTGDLVTVVEIISPGNKEKPDAMMNYRARRERLLIDRGVNVVEIDLTRSVKRLVLDTLVNRYAYHIAVYLPGYDPRLIGMDYGQALKRFALPLRGEVVPLELQAAYEHAYQLFAIAGQIDKYSSYAETELPFPSLLTDQQIAQALRAAAEWRAKLAELSRETS
jgi:hypothetical protein